MPTPPGRNARYLSFDLWRGVACLMVVVHHAAVALRWEDGGVGGAEGIIRRLLLVVAKAGQGPPLFFLISGYCVAASIDSCRAKGTRPVLFLARRFWRIFPPYWFALAGFVLVVAGLDALGLERLHRGEFALGLNSPWAMNRAQWLGNLTLTETWRPLLGGGNAEVFTRVAWSLCFQEQFYVICFLVLLLAPRRFHAVMAATTLAIIAYRVFAWDSGGMLHLEGLFPLHWHEFAAGLAVYWRLNAPIGRAARRGIDLALASMFVVGVAEGYESTVLAAVLGLALIALRPHDARLAGMTCLAPLAACGRRCYSIYLVHLPVVAVMNHALVEIGVQGFWGRALVMVPAASAASIGLGFLFYRMVESRFVEMPDLAPLRGAFRQRTRALRLAGLGTLAAAMIALPALPAWPTRALEGPRPNVGRGLASVASASTNRLRRPCKPVPRG